jgi:hypothetical protein
MKASRDQSSQLPEPLFFEGANDEFVRPIFELPHRLAIDLTTTDDAGNRNRQPASKVFS